MIAGINIWLDTGGLGNAQTIGGRGFRLVESQESVATTKIVATLESQAILEQMLDEESKPMYRAGTDHLDYLLATPFRYPPLAHGSRFGGRFEPSLFYGGTGEQVTLCESAFYRFFFYLDMEEPPLAKVLQTQHTLFGFQYQTDMGVKLPDPPFDVFEEALRNPADYGVTQALGAVMRDDGVQAFEYRSAREPSGGINIALFSAGPFKRRRPVNRQACFCQVDSQRVVFSLGGKIRSFELEDFLVGGSFPFPAQ